MGVTSKTISVNRQAHHDYYIEDAIEAGLVLTGTEIKSLRLGRVTLRDAYAWPQGEELWLLNSYIAPYEGGNRYNHEPGRPRKLLLHREEIESLVGTARQKGYALVPLKLYLKRGRAKVELGIGRGKKLYDKRQTIAERDAQREMERVKKSQFVKRR